MARKSDAPPGPSTPEGPAAGAAESSSGTHVDVVGVVTSAGGLEAISAVLRALPAELDAAVVVAQHLGGQGSQLVPILDRRTALPVEWARDGEPLRAGRVLVCPYRSTLEVLPDRTCAVRKIDSSLDRPLDALLTSLAQSLGSGALGVVLTGMGTDGARGAAALKRAGGIVIAQSEDTADHPSMPRAAIEAGVDLVLPLHEIGGVVGEVVSGARLPRPRSEMEAAEALFAGPGQARAELRRIDWSATPLGPVTAWSPALRTLVRAVLDTDFPMFLMWGPDLVQIGNDAYAPTLGTKRMQGLPVQTTWAELWDVVRPQFEQVRRTGQPIFARDVHLSPNRRGFVEEAYFTYCYSPLHDDGELAGILETSLETTARVLADRRLAALRTLGAACAGAESASRACERAARALAEYPNDIPFALIYLHDAAQGSANLCACTGVQAGSEVAPRTLDVRRGHVAWPLGRVLTEAEPLVVEELPARFSAFHAGPWPEPPAAAVLLPLRPVAGEPPVGVLVAGFSARLAPDDAYRGFLDLVAKQVSASLAEARARQREHERLERLAELDRARTEFFSNVSHEFRTPLTLILGPLEELLRRGDGLPAPVTSDVDTAARSARRLLALVNTLLDFSQMEAGRLHAHFQATDLGALTAGVASVFRSTVERAGLRFAVSTHELREPAWVDREMWEKIVSNLLANAIKFTFEGEIEVRLNALPKHAELVVRDTGVGIPPQEQPQIFKRFHRVRASRARTHDGAGIGLALVAELVRLHHGRVRVKSEPGRGSTFTVWVPLGRRIVDTAQESVPAAAGVAAALAEEAAAWVAPAAGRTPDGVLPEALGAPRSVDAVARGTGASILVAEDNADMRDYLHRLLSPYWRVELAVDGEEALGRARLSRPDLVLADVMMPRLDGFGLLAALRADDELRQTSVILVTARAGEEAAIQGLLAGADDYVAKPFSARELIARIGGQIELSRLRRRTAELNELLVRFSDAVRGLSDPGSVAEAACRILTERLRTGRTAWADVDLEAREYVAGCVVLADGTRGEPSRWPLAASDSFAAEHLAGRPVVYADAGSDPRIPRRVMTEMVRRGHRAGIAMPVVVDGTLRGVLATSQDAPRRWTPEDVAFVEALAGRTWAEVERARARAALRESEERQVFLLRLSDALRVEPDADAMAYRAVRMLVEHMQLDRACILSCRVEDDRADVTHQAGNDRVPPLPDVLRLSDYPFAPPLTFHQTLVIEEEPEPQGRSEAGKEMRAMVAGTLRRSENRPPWSMVAMSALPRGWTPGEIALVEEVTERTWAAMERARAEAVLRAGELRQAFLLKLSDALRTLADPDEVMATATRLLGEELKVNRAMYAQITGDEWIVGRLYETGVDRLPPGGYAAGKFGRWTMDSLLQGRDVAIPDTRTDERLRPAERRALQGIGAGAVLGVPLVRNGKVAAVLSLHTRTPRGWTPADLDMVRETAERTWPAVERARAEAALRESEEKYRRIFENMRQGYTEGELARDVRGRAAE